MCDACNCGGAADTVVLKVEGMSCNHCKMAVEKALLKVDGIISAEVNLAEKSVVITFDNERANVDKMKNVIVDAGYTVVG